MPRSRGAWVRGKPAVKVNEEWVDVGSQKVG